MRIALYIENGYEQIVLTPEGDTEKRILEQFHTKGRVMSIKKGGFYHCQGGWVRQSADESSTILTLRTEEEA
jgi:hypothetical protein